MPDPAGQAELEALYREYADRVYGFLRHRIDQHTAEDVLADTFLVAWRKRDRIPAEPLPWLYVIARGELNNRVRAEMRRRALTERLTELATEPATTEIAETVATRQELVRGLLRLPHTDREVLMLAGWYELSTPQAAKALGCTTAAFLMRLHRARRRLRQALATEETGTVPEVNPR